MIAAVIILGLVIAALLILRDREQKAHDSHVKGLLDRIQFPEVRQVAPGPQIDYVPPKDEAELAYVGGFVPDGISVGMTDD